MCIECNCFGTVTPYGVGGRTPTELPKAPNVAMSQQTNSPYW
jgi:hypothetical protein